MPTKRELQEMLEDTENLLDEMAVVVSATGIGSDEKLAQLEDMIFDDDEADDED